MLSNESTGEYHYRNLNTQYINHLSASETERHGYATTKCQDPRESWSAFDKQEYYRGNPDVFEANVDAEDHYNLYGKSEGRKLSWSQEYLKFRNEGIIIIKDSVDSPIIDSALASFHEFKNRYSDVSSRHSDEYGFLRRVTNLHRYSDAIAALFCENRALSFADYVFNSKTSLYTSLYFEAGSEQPIHRDTPYFHTNPVNQFLGLWVALEDATIQNGALLAIKGGHLVPELDLVDIAAKSYRDPGDIKSDDQQLWISYQDLMSHSCEGMHLAPEVINVSRGDTVIWHPMLPHGGSKILHQHLSRNSIVFHVTPEGVPVLHQDYFFNPSRPMPKDPAWDYLNIRGRKVADISPYIIFSGSARQDKVLV